MNPESLHRESRPEEPRPGVYRQAIARFDDKRRSLMAAKDIELAAGLKEKLRNAEPLSRADTAFLLKLKKAFDERGGGVCDSEEFDLTAESCRSCEDFHACLYRFLIGTVS